MKPTQNRRVVAEGLTIDDFIVDHAGRTETCPNGLIRPISRAGWATFGAACATVSTAGPPHSQP